MFMSSLLISKYGFRDSGFSGFNNPTELARQEIDELWPDEKPGTIISIGTDFSSLVLGRPCREKAITNQYAQMFVKQVIEKLSPTVQTSEAMSNYALSIVKQLVTLAVDTEITHSEASSKLPQKCVATFCFLAFFYSTLTST